MITPAQVTAAVTAAGLAQAVLGLGLVRRFRGRPAAPAGARPAVSVLKPLHGDEPLLEEALASLCAQDYRPLQIVFGVQDPRDPALGVVERLRARFPDLDIAVVVDATLHGRNRKISNLINMYPAAVHDVLVIADSDVHATPGYVASLVDALERPRVGLATVLYAGRPATETVAGALGASGITHSFLPGAVMARWLGRQDCLGATMALRRDTLEAIGGLQALADEIGDDHVLGVLVRGHGLQVALADTVPATTVPEARLRDLFDHELRWARTIAGVVPVQFALATVQYSLFWGMLAVLLSGFTGWAVLLLLGVWAVRAAVGHGVDQALGLAGRGLASRVPIWLLPIRDVLSVAVVVTSYLGREVVWRGERIALPGHGAVRSAATLPAAVLPAAVLPTAVLPASVLPASVPMLLGTEQ